MTTEDDVADEASLTPHALPYRFRRFQQTADIARLARLYDAIEAVDQDDDHTDTEVLRAQLTWPGHDPLLDRWVVENPDHPDELIGFAGLWKAPATERADTIVRVHPAWRRHGIGGELFARIEQRARERGAATLGAYVNVWRTNADAFMRKHGFVAVSFYTRLRAPVEVLHTAPAPVWPDGVCLRSFAQDERIDALLTAFNDCFEGQWGHVRLTEDDLRAWLPQLDPNGAFLAFDARDQVIGMCRAELSKEFSAKHGQPVGYLDSPGVVPAYRDDPTTLYLPLTLAALRWLGTPGALSETPALVIMESWGDLPATLALYQSLGFTITHQEHSYRLDIK
ncbi:MAG TPA: GNAT family N-acetyltransferase [Ktedonobacterales bacterium]|nr:GNAT family N-acetyltransferase [Ktedonobacterales bacterium]